PVKVLRMLSSAPCDGRPQSHAHIDGAGRGTRTLTLLPAADFESAASTDSAIPAKKNAVLSRHLPQAATTCFSRSTTSTTHFPLNSLHNKHLPTDRPVDFCCSMATQTKTASSATCQIWSNRAICWCSTTRA